MFKTAQPVNKARRTRLKARFHEMKGQVKEKAEQATNNPDLESKSQAEKAVGKIQKKIGPSRAGPRTESWGSF
jgi:uncharacterized protein YjbJ (UPF0337 family)